MMYLRKSLSGESVRDRRIGQNISLMAVFAAGFVALYFWGFVSTINRTFGSDK
jgi:hypothetical protein